MMDLQENLQQVEANICKACENAGRKCSDRCQQNQANRNASDSI